jgi:hypothetical protein
MNKYKLPEIKIDTISKSRYFLAFVYLPNKVEVCKAKSIRSILTHYASGPTAHVALCKVNDRKTTFQFFLVVGKYSTINKAANKYFYKIIRTAPVILQPGDSKRSRYHLIKEEWKDNIGFNKTVEVVFAWRQLPKKHLLQLAQADDPTLIRKQKEREKNRWSNLEFK